MIQGVVNQEVSEHFTVTDSYGTLITGIDSSAFTAYVYNPNDIETSISISGEFVELGDGNYKYKFTPDMIGIWYVMITHPIYFPWGKADDIQIYNEDIDSIALDVKKTLGLSHHNFLIDLPTYDDFGNLINARVRTYSTAVDVGTDNNVLETYLLTADSTAAGKFNYWKQVKV